MSRAAGVTHRVKGKWRVIVDGLEAGYAIECQIPEVEVKGDGHTAGGEAWETKRPGGVLVFGDITIKKIAPTSGSDKWAWDWIKTQVDVKTGAGRPPAEYLKGVTIQHLDEQDAPIDTWECVNCWVKKSSWENNVGGDATKMVETVILSTDKYDRP